MTLSIRTRITLGNIGQLAVALLIFAAAARFVIGHVMLRTLDRSLEDQAARMVDRWSNGDEPLLPGGPEGPLFGPNPFRRPEGGGPRFYTSGPLYPPHRIHRDGRGAWSKQGFALAQQEHHPVHGEARDDDGRPLRVFSAPVYRDGEFIGVVQSAAPREELDAALRDVSYSLLLLLPISALLAALLGIRATRRALAPVEELTRAAAQIEATSLDARLPEPGGNDEFDTLARMLNRMLTRLETAFVRQKQFTSHASHELRTPLAVVKTATTLLAGPTPLPPELAREAVLGADEAVDRANRLITDLLFLTRTENGRMPVRLREVALEPTVQQAVRSAQSAFGSAPSAAVEIDVSGVGTIQSDQDLLQRVVVNLVGNALRHTPAEGRVTLHATLLADTFTLTVTDTGSGIAPEHLARLGEPFYRPDLGRSRDDGGSGLGVSICNAIIGALGGTLTLTSVVGKGTTATIRLPQPRL